MCRMQLEINKDRNTQMFFCCGGGERDLMCVVSRHISVARLDDVVAMMSTVKPFPIGWKPTRVHALNEITWDPNVNPPTEWGENDWNPINQKIVINIWYVIVFPRLFFFCLDYRSHLLTLIENSD